jgi:hypothetical protein
VRLFLKKIRIIPFELGGSHLVESPSLRFKQGMALVSIDSFLNEPKGDEPMSEPITLEYFNDSGVHSLDKYSFHFPGYSKTE